ncbi:MAG TPA: tetratricopeptide repeat protein [Candidatus Acidoferrales bacterium]|nr:tetratricopeptide repeat protein [Candidatus Acidoferrales bacterium]
MARIQRQELKHDEFIDTLDATLIYVEEHTRTLLIIALAVVLGGGSLGVLYWYSQQQERKASVALAKGLITFQAPVQEGLPPLPGSSVQQTFASQEDKFRAAEKEFAAVHSDFPRTRSGRLARHYQALCQFEVGETDAAVATLEELARARDTNEAALAKLHLAGFYQRLNRRADAAKLYRELADHPTDTVPRAMALLELATLEATENPEEARRLYTEIKNEFPDTPIAAEVTQRLELLPASPPAQP